jgi:hypothetical protein
LLSCAVFEAEPELGPMEPSESTTFVCLFVFIKTKQ